MHNQRDDGFGEQDGYARVRYYGDLQDDSSTVTPAQREHAVKLAAVTVAQMFRAHFGGGR